MAGARGVFQAPSRFGIAGELEAFSHVMTSLSVYVDSISAVNRIGHLSVKLLEGPVSQPLTGQNGGDCDGNARPPFGRRGGRFVYHHVSLR